MRSEYEFRACWRHGLRLEVERAADVGEFAVISGEAQVRNAEQHAGMDGVDAVDAFLHGGGVMAYLLRAGRGGQGGGGKQNRRGGRDKEQFVEHGAYLSWAG